MQKGRRSKKGPPLAAAQAASPSLTASTSPTAGPAASPAEVKAIQVERAVRVHTGRGELIAMPGQWLVTQSDGSVRVVTDEVFRLQTLRQELLQMILKGGQSKARRRA